MRILPVSLWEPASTQRISQLPSRALAMAARPPCLEPCLWDAELFAATSVPAAVSALAASGPSSLSWTQSTFLCFCLLTLKDIFHHILETWKTAVKFLAESFKLHFQKMMLCCSLSGEAITCMKFHYTGLPLETREPPGPLCFHTAPPSYLHISAQLLGFVSSFPEFENLQTILRHHR